MHLYHFRKTVTSKDGKTILIKPLTIEYIIDLYKMYASLSYKGKLFFHPPYFNPKFGLSRIICETLLIISCFYAIRKILLRFIPITNVYLSLIALNPMQEIVGFTTLRIVNRLPDGGYVAIGDGIVVNGNYQGKGLGSQLLKVSENRLAGAYGVQRIYTSVHVQNIHWITNLCEKFGYQIIKMENDSWENEVLPTYKMMRKL